MTQRTAVEAGAELPRVVRQVTQARINAYADASGDYNPLHLDPEFAATTQFDGIIAHGMLVLAFVSEMLTEAFGRAWLESGRLKVRFRAPTRPGDTVTAGGRVVRREGGCLTCEIACRSEAGEVLVSGEAEVTVE